MKQTYGLHRIIALEPSIAATLIALGQQTKLVAVSEHCQHLPAVASLPRLPSTWSIRVDAITPLRPDLVIASAPFQAESVAALLQAQVDVLCLAPTCLADVYRHIALLGKLTDAALAAEDLIDKMQADLATLQQTVAGRPRPRVYVEMWPKPAMNSMTWVAELVEVAGGEFVPLPPGRTVMLEELQMADPQVIVVAWAGVPTPNLAQVYRRAGWQAIGAIRTGNVFAVDEMLLNAPGPNLVQGAWQLAAALHGISRGKEKP